MTQVKNLPPDNDTIRILLTTDNHVGYNEKDPIRGDDSWKTFEEIMWLARERNVDMVLQAGDLFHINKPSKKSLFHVMRILRSTCYGDKPFELELLSDPSLAMDNRGFNHPNYEDPNINVSIPVFGISGNHDDATGDELISPMDILSMSGLFNHFGRVIQNDKIDIYPLLFQKGATKFALYGMASVRDERLFRTFRDGNVSFKKPAVARDEWFNLMCVHQNHVAHNFTSYLPETFLPGFLDLVLWGHEHECIPYTVPNSEAGFDVLQPGSSVATSLCEGETAAKNVFILSVKGRDYSLEPVKLKSVRPFIMKDITLSTSGLIPSSGNRSEVVEYLIDQIEGLIEEAKRRYVENLEEEEEEVEDVEIPLPLVRVRVEYSGGFEVENPRRFSNRFVGKVANVDDVVVFHQKRQTDADIIKRSKKLKSVAAETEVNQDEEGNVNVSNLVDSLLEDGDLNLLSKADMRSVIENYISREDKSILRDFVDQQIAKDFEVLVQVNDDIHQDAPDADSMKKGFKQILKQIKQEKRESQSGQPEVYVNVDPEVVVSDGDETPKPKKRATKSSAKPPARSRAKPAAKPTRRKPVQTPEIVSDSEDDIISISPPKKRAPKGDIGSMISCLARKR